MLGMKSENQRDHSWFRFAGPNRCFVVSSTNMKGPLGQKNVNSSLHRPLRLENIMYQNLVALRFGIFRASKPFICHPTPSASASKTVRTCQQYRHLSDTFNIFHSIDSQTPYLYLQWICVTESIRAARNMAITWGFTTCPYIVWWINEGTLRLSHLPKGHDYPATDATQLQYSPDDCGEAPAAGYHSLQRLSFNTTLEAHLEDIFVRQPERLYDMA